MAEGEKLAEQFKFLMEWFNGLSEFERCDILYREYYGRSMYLAQLQMQAQMEALQIKKQEEMEPVQTIVIERKTDQFPEEQAKVEEAHILIDQMDSYFKEAEFVASKIDCECCHGFVTSCEGEACVVDSLCICSK